MDKNTRLLLGMAKIKKGQETQLIPVKGFDVLGFFFPFLRLLIAGLWGKFFLFLVTCFVYPIWCWYIGFNFKRIHFESMLAQGWTVVED